MKLSKSLIMAALVAGSLLAGSAALQAQNATNPPPAGAPPAGPRGLRGAQNIDQMAATLKLDDATKAKFKAILQDMQKKTADLRADTTLSQQDRRTKMQAARDDTAKQLKTLLTADQFDQWQKMSQPRQRRTAPVGNPPAANPPAANPPQN